MPMLQRSLLCRIDACPGSHLIEGSTWLERSVQAACIHDKAMCQFRSEVARRFHLKIEGAWITAKFDGTLIPFLDHMRELWQLGTARLGAGYLTEKIVYSDQFSWYRLAPKLGFDSRNRKRGVAELLAEPWGPYGSSRFRGIVEGEKLRGMLFGPPSFEPIRGDRRSWYACLPGATVGRGLDHEWAPPNELPVIDGNGRIGANMAHNNTAKIDRLDPEVATLCGLFPPGELHLKSFTRLWAGSIPETDFSGFAGIGPFRRWNTNGICIGRSAVEILMAAGVIDPEMLEPIDVVEIRGDPHVPILDEVVGPLPESLTTLVEERRSVEILEEAADESGDPANHPRFLVIPASCVGEDRVSTAEIDLAATQLGVVLPRIWTQFLSEIGLVDLWDMYPLHPSSWAEEQPDHDDLRAGDDTLPSRMLTIGRTMNGDHYSLNLDHVTEDGDCPLLMFDHETNRCVDCWPSVAQLINEMLSESEGESQPEAPNLHDE